jgi:hypothetical protein
MMLLILISIDNVIVVEACMLLGDNYRSFFVTEVIQLVHVNIDVLSLYFQFVFIDLAIEFPLHVVGDIGPEVGFVDGDD